MRASPPSPQAPAALVGRAAELALVAPQRSAAGAVEGRLVEVTGPPGIGKTRLVQALQDEVAGLATLRVEGATHLRLSPYAALSPGLRALVGAGADDRPGDVAPALAAALAERLPGREPWLALLAPAWGLDLPDTEQTASLTPELAPARRHELIGELLAALLPAGGSLLLVEDAHWLDEASAALLTSLLAGAVERGWLAVVTRRAGPDGPACPAEAVRLELGPLNAADARELAGAGAHAAAIARRAQGHPLHVLELAATGAPPEALPDDLGGVIAARLRELPAEAAQHLRALSVLGVSFPLALAEGLLPDAASALAALDHDLALGPDGVVRFRHALVRDAAYAGLPVRRRRALHLRAADAVQRLDGGEPEERAGAVALHLLAAGRIGESFAFSRQAADHATRRRAPAEAVAHLRRSLRAAAELSDLGTDALVELQAELGEAALRAAMFAFAADAFGAARRLAERPELRARLARRLAIVRERTGALPAALAWCTRGLRELEGETSPAARAERVALRLAAASMRMRQGRYAQAVRMLEPVVAEAEALGEQAVLANASYLLDWALTDLGRPEQARPHRERALALADALGDHHIRANVLNHLGIDAYYEGDWAAALRCYGASRRGFELIGDVVQAAMSANNIGEVRSDQGRLAEAEALFDDALLRWRAAGYELGVAVALGNLGRCAARGGQGARAAALLAEARSRFVALDAASLAAEMAVRDAERLALSGEPVAALAAAQTALADDAARLTPAVAALAHRVAGEALAVLDRPAAARDALAAAVGCAREGGAGHERALAARSLAALNADRAGLGAADAALARLGVEPAPVLAAPRARRRGAAPTPEWVRPA